MSNILLECVEILAWQPIALQYDKKHLVLYAPRMIL